MTRIPARSTLSALGCAALLAVSPLAQAQHAHGAHEHGVAHLSVATDGGELLIELTTPLDNLVGFEHAPRTAAQRKAMAAAEQRLREGGALFAPSTAAGCALREVSVESPWPQGGEQADGHKHDHKHDHDHGDDGHADLVASYRFECSAPAALERIDTALFDAFPRLRELRAAHASGRGQGSAVLKPGAAALKL